MHPKDLSYTAPVRKSLYAGFGLVCLLIGAFIWEADSTLRTLYQEVNTLHDHPLAASNAVTTLKADLLQMRYMMTEASYSASPSSLDSYPKVEFNLRRDVNKQLDILRKEFLGNMKVVELLQSNFDVWIRNRDPMYSMKTSGRHQEMRQKLLVQSTPIYYSMLEQIGYIETLSLDKEHSIIDEMRTLEKGAEVRLKFIGIVLVFSVAIIALLTRAKLIKLTAILEEQATRDTLTGLMNRRSFLEVTEQVIARENRYNEFCVLAVVDIDHFKSVNDTHGHGVGDEALKHFSKICAQELRKTDFLGRIGGEEFGILLPRTSLSAAIPVIERIRKMVESTPLKLHGHDNELQITASFGLAQLGVCEKRDIHALFCKADKSLYEAKKSGRNRLSYQSASPECAKDCAVQAT